MKFLFVKLIISLTEKRIVKKEENPSMRPELKLAINSKAMIKPNRFTEIDP